MFVWKVNFNGNYVYTDEYLKSYIKDMKVYNGNMLKNISTHDKPQAVNDSNKNDYELPPAILDKFLTTIKGQAEEIGVLREQIRQLEQRLGKTADNASIGATANVG